MNLKNAILILSLLISSASALAAPHGEGIPTKDIFWQVFNLTIIGAVLFYYLRPTVREYFSGRSAAFLVEAQKSQAAKLEAEKQYQEIKTRLEHLQSTKSESIARAEAEAADLRKQLLREAEEIASRIKKDAQDTVQMELGKARADLQKQFVQQALQSAREVLTKDIGAQDHGRLQTSFAQGVQEVNP